MLAQDGKDSDLTALPFGRLAQCRYSADMDHHTLDALRARLLDMQSALMDIADTTSQATATVELDQASVGRLSRMDALQGQQMAHEAERRRQRQLLAVEGALRRMDQGEYGECFICAKQINPKRLLVDPTVTRCIDCVEDDT